MTKSFKDYVVEQKEPTLKTVKATTPKVKKQAEKPVVQEPSFVMEVVKNEVKETVEKQIREDVEKELRSVLKEEYQHELDTFKTQLQESLMESFANSVFESNRAILAAVSKLVEKIDGLQESLKLEIPTPIVQFTAPHHKVTKIVNRDKHGNIVSVTEEIGKDDI